MRTAKLILNPIAGRGRAGALRTDIHAALRQSGIETDVALTRAPREATDVAQRAREDGFELVIAAGGDGTLHEVINGLMRAAGSAPAGALCIIPIGTGNDFIKALNLSKDWRAACQRIAVGQTRLVDIGRLNQEFFANNIGVGFDAQVGIEAAKITWAQGMAVYVIALARHLLLSHRTPHVNVELDGKNFAQRITLLTVGNGRCAGGGFWLTPHAEVDDGWFDICIADRLNRAQILALVPEVMKGTHINKRPVHMARARRVVITSDEPLPVHADGEILYTDAHRLEVELLPQKLEVIT